MDSSPLSRLTTAAAGFCELGMWQDAWDELESLSPEERAEPEVMLLRLGIFIGLKKWESAAALAEFMAEKGSTAGAVFQLGAYAIRRCRSLPEARAFLLRGFESQRQNPIWHFNLACYECQLGNIADTKSLLEVAFQLNPDLRALAREEADLEPLWDSLRP